MHKAKWVYFYGFAVLIASYTLDIMNLMLINVSGVLALLLRASAIVKKRHKTLTVFLASSSVHPRNLWSMVLGAMWLYTTHTYTQTPISPLFPILSPSVYARKLLSSRQVGWELYHPIPRADIDSALQVLLTAKSGYFCPISAFLPIVIYPWLPLFALRRRRRDVVRRRFGIVGNGSQWMGMSL